jgi:hypothetical protein
MAKQIAAGPSGFEVVGIHWETGQEVLRELVPFEGRVYSASWQRALWEARLRAAVASRTSGCGVSYVTTRMALRGMEFPGRILVFRFGQEVSQEAKQLWLPLGILGSSDPVRFAAECRQLREIMEKVA